MSSNSTYVVFVTMMLQLFDKQFDLTSRECVFLEIWNFFVSANSHSQSHRLNHDTNLDNQRLVKMFHRFDRVKVVKMFYEIRIRSSVSASEQTTVKMFHESNSIINSTNEQTTIKMFYTTLRWRQKNWKMSIQFYIYSAIDHSITYETTLYMITRQLSINYVSKKNYLIDIRQSSLIETFDRSSRDILFIFRFRYFILFNRTSRKN